MGQWHFIAEFGLTIFKLIGRSISIAVFGITFDDLVQVGGDNYAILPKDSLLVVVDVWVLCD